MLAYTTVGSTDFQASLAFFDAAMREIGCVRIYDYSATGWVAYGREIDKDNPTAPTLWICKTPFNGAPSSVGNGTMVGLSASTRAQVDAFHAVALANGGSSEGAPGTRETYGPDFYVAYVRDPMGNKLAVVCRGLA